MTRRLTLLAVALLGVALLAGCVGGEVGSTKPKSTWTVALLGYDTVSQIAADVPGYAYFPDEGYVWLVIDLRVTNTAREGRSINWLWGDAFKLNLGGNAYSQRLHLNDPPGYLPTSYNPQQTREGFIAFEIPAGVDPKGAKLLWSPRGGPDVVFTLP